MHLLGLLTICLVLKYDNKCCYVLRVIVTGVYELNLAMCFIRVIVLVLLLHTRAIFLKAFQLFREVLDRRLISHGTLRRARRLEKGNANVTASL